MELKYIHATASHVPFIAHSWLKSMRQAPEFRAMEEDQYYTWAKKHVAAQLQTARGVVVVDPEEEDNVIGYLVYEGPVMHWAYIRRDWRNQGIFKELKEIANVEAYSHRSATWKHTGALRYEPWFAR